MWGLWNNSKSIIRCKDCEFLIDWRKSPYIYQCIGQCSKMKEYCTIKDGCTFGKITTNKLEVGITCNRESNVCLG